MKNVVLIFPDTSQLADFLLRHHLSKTAVDTGALSLEASMEDDQIVLACTEYQAYLKKASVAEGSS